MKFNKNQIKWFVISIILLIGFILFTPIVLFFKYGVIISMIEGIICAFFILLGILKINKTEEIFHIDDKVESKRFDSVFIPFISFIIIGILIHTSISAKIDNKLKNEGIFAKAKVINGEELIKKSIRRTSRTYNVRISFKDSLTGQAYRFTTEINKEIFNSLHKNQIIEIKYLPQTPSVFKLMVGKNVKTFKNISNRFLDLSDFENLLKLEDVEAQMNYLNKISLGWEQGEYENSILFRNELKRETLAILSTKTLLYQGENIDNLMRQGIFIKMEDIPIIKEPG